MPTLWAVELPMCTECKSLPVMPPGPLCAECMRRGLSVHRCEACYVAISPEDHDRGDKRCVRCSFSHPLPMLLWCPECGARHIDVGDFAHKPHHTHACQGCGRVWRPAIVATCGVQFLPGFKNT